jgi:ribosome-binding ATPase YchF (GTP1/OBG family)
VGPEECRAWSVNKGDTAQTAAGKIHSDIAQFFITAETASYDDYVEFGGSAGCKAQGKLRAEGREYLCKDGDVFNFKFNVTKSK